MTTFKKIKYFIKPFSSYPTRTASLHIMNQSSSTVSAATGTIPTVGTLQTPIHIVKHSDASTQTDTPTSKFSRTFSVMGSRRKTMDEDVQTLIESCRRYQVSSFLWLCFVPFFFLLIAFEMMHF